MYTMDLRFVNIEELKNIDLDQVDLTVQPPESEPQRQYYFMAKVRAHVKALSAKIGRPLFYHTETFGCPTV